MGGKETEPTEHSTGGGKGRRKRRRKGGRLRMSTKKGGRGGGKLQVWHRGEQESVGITGWNPDVQNQWRRRRNRRKRERKAPTTAQRQMEESWGPEHGIVEHRCTKPVEEEEEEHSNLGMRTKRRAQGMA